MWQRYRESNPGLRMENLPQLLSDLIRAAEFKAYHRAIRPIGLALKKRLEGRIGGLGICRFELLQKSDGEERQKNSRNQSQVSVGQYLFADTKL